MPDTSYEAIKVDLLPDLQVYGFGIRGCDKSSILLLDQQEPSSLVYQIDIGYDDNTFTYIKDSTGTNVAEKVTPHILDCSRIRTFYIKVSISGQFSFNISG